MAVSLYEKLGASATKAGLHEALGRVGMGASDRFFALLSDDIAGDPDFASVLHCDGAGTKSIVAYLFFRETGDRKVFCGLAQDALVMNLDDVFCVGCPESILIANSIARNRRLVDDQIIGEIIGGYQRLVSQLIALGLPVELSGGETADCGDIVRTLLVDAVVAGRIKRERLIDTSRIVPGDVIVGLSSTGQAKHETTANSGISSNGLTLARHALLSKAYLDEYPESVDSGLGLADIYRGKFRLTDTPASLGMRVGEALLSPTRCYAPILRDITQSLRSDVHGLIHLTGGGQGKVLRFGRANRYVKDNLFDPPPLFRLIQETAQVEWREMFQVFNMGHRIEAYVPRGMEFAVIDIANEWGIEARVVGRVEALPASSQAKNELKIECKQGLFEYSL